MFAPATINVISCLVLALLAAGALAPAVRHYRRTRYTWAQAPFYFIHLVYTRIVWRGRISRSLPVKPGQGAIVVSNHIGPIDPAFIQLGADKVVHWMVAREYSLNPWLAWMFRITESIPVNRGGIDTAATKMAIRYAQQGDVVGVFPEGHINPHPDQVLLLPGRMGAAMIALKARVPVIPCYLTGVAYDGTSYGTFLMTAKVYVEVGDPLDFSEYYDRDHDREVLEEVTGQIMIAIARLAGVDDYEPKIASRGWKAPELVAQ